MRIHQFPRRSFPRRSSRLLPLRDARRSTRGKGAQSRDDPGQEGAGFLVGGCSDRLAAGDCDSVDLSDRVEFGRDACQRRRQWTGLLQFRAEDSARPQFRCRSQNHVLAFIQFKLV